MLSENWVPTERQAFALARQEYEILYGGARGGGKTDCGMAFLLYNIHEPRFRALVIRRNADDLKDWVDRATTFYARVGGVKTGNPAEFTFPSGAVIRTGHLKDANAYMKYQGHEYQNLVLEELPQIAREEDYMRLLASCRSTVPGLSAQVFCTANPGGPGHDWVKKRFIVPADPETPFTDTISGRGRIYIPALVYDNPHIMEHDPEYVKYLESLPPALRKQWLEGSWEDFDVDGAIFGNEMRDAKTQGRLTRVPFDPLLPVDTWWDLGHRDYNIVWFVQQVGREIRFIDLYQVQFSNMRAILIELKDRAQALGYKYGTFVLPHDINVHEYSTGVTRAESFVTYMRELFDREMRLGIDYKIAPAMSYGNADGIDAARVLLPYCWFDVQKCAEGVYALKSYHREKIDGTNVYKDKPKHDEYSHAATAFMYGAMMTESFTKQRQEHEKQQLKQKARIMLPKRGQVNYLTGEMI